MLYPEVPFGNASNEPIGTTPEVTGLPIGADVEAERSQIPPDEPETRSRSLSHPAPARSIRHPTSTYSTLTRSRTERLSKSVKSKFSSLRSKLPLRLSFKRTPSSPDVTSDPTISHSPMFASTRPSWTRTRARTRPRILNDWLDGLVSADNRPDFPDTYSEANRRAMMEQYRRSDYAPNLRRRSENERYGYVQRRLAIMISLEAATEDLVRTQHAAHQVEPEGLVDRTAQVEMARENAAEGRTVDSVP